MSNMFDRNTLTIIFDFKSCGCFFTSLHVTTQILFSIKLFQYYIQHRTKAIRGNLVSPHSDFISFAFSPFSD